MKTNTCTCTLLSQVHYLSHFSPRPPLSHTHTHIYTHTHTQTQTHTFSFRVRLIVSSESTHSINTHLALTASSPYTSSRGREPSPLPTIPSPSWTLLTLLGQRDSVKLMWVRIDEQFTNDCACYVNYSNSYFSCFLVSQFLLNNLSSSKNCKSLCSHSLDWFQSKSLDYSVAKFTLEVAKIKCI